MKFPYAFAGWLLFGIFWIGGWMLATWNIDLDRLVFAIVLGLTYLCATGFGLLIAFFSAKASEARA